MISICITTHQHPQQLDFLSRLLLSVSTQKVYGHIETVVSDDSENDDVKWYCCNDLYDGHYPVRYIRNERKGKSSINMNNAINHAQGEIIKPMFSDDYFVESDSLSKMVVGMRNAHWGFATSTHSNDREDFHPKPHRSVKELALGENTYGCPSAMIFWRTDLRFDERYVWLMDCEFYARMYQRYGAPAIIDTRIGIREWDGQQSNVAAHGHQRLVETQLVGTDYADIR